MSSKYLKGKELEWLLRRESLILARVIPESAVCTGHQLACIGAVDC